MIATTKIWLHKDAPSTFMALLLVKFELTITTVAMDTIWPTRTRKFASGAYFKSLVQIKLPPGPHHLFFLSFMSVIFF
jgi:hypothetical protein